MQLNLLTGKETRKSVVITPDDKHWRNELISSAFAILADVRRLPHSLWLVIWPSALQFRDKSGYHVTQQNAEGQTDWGIQREELLQSIPLCHQSSLIKSKWRVHGSLGIRNSLLLGCWGRTRQGGQGGTWGVRHKAHTYRYIPTLISLGMLRNEKNYTHTHRESKVRKCILYM